MYVYLQPVEFALPLIACKQQPYCNEKMSLGWKIRGKNYLCMDRRYVLSTAKCLVVLFSLLANDDGDGVAASLTGRRSRLQGRGRDWRIY